AALPATDATNMLREEAMIAPNTPNEKRLAGIVTPILGVEEIGIDDNIFLLGGNSLMGTQIIARVVEAFEVDLPLLTLFEAPTIRQLSTEIEQRILAKVAAMSEYEVLRLLQ